MDCPHIHIVFVRVAVPEIEGRAEVLREVTSVLRCKNCRRIALLVEKPGSSEGCTKVSPTAACEEVRALFRQEPSEIARRLGEVSGIPFDCIIDDHTQTLYRRRDVSVLVEREQREQAMAANAHLN